MIIKLFKKKRWKHRPLGIDNPKELMIKKNDGLKVETIELEILNQNFEKKYINLDILE